jgi:DedD protein
MEKKKLLLVAVSVGVFLVIVLSAALLIFTPTAGGAAISAAKPLSTGAVQPGVISPDTAGSIPAGVVRGPASADATDMVRNAGDLQGLQTPPVSDNADSSAGVVISVPKPSAPEVPAPGTRPAASSGAAAIPSSPSPASGQGAAKGETQVIATGTKSPAAPAPVPSSGTAASGAAATGNAVKGSQAVSAAPAKTTSPASTTTRTTAPAAAVRTPSRALSDYWIQTGAFSALVRAEDAKETLASKGLSSIIDDRDVDGQTWYRVRVGPYTSENEANYWLALVKAIDGFKESQVRSTLR